MARSHSPFHRDRHAHTAGTGERADLLRRSHIFAAAVCETLAADPLREVTAAPLSVSQLRLLRLIDGDGLHRLRDLAEVLGVSVPAASKSVDKLVRLGLAVRHRSPRDRRALLAFILPAGRRLIAAHEHAARERLDRALVSFSSAELAAFSGLLERFSLALLDNPAARARPCLRCSAHVSPDCPVRLARDGCPHARVRLARARRTAAAATAARRG